MLVYSFIRTSAVAFKWAGVLAISIEVSGRKQKTENLLETMLVNDSYEFRALPYFARTRARKMSLTSKHFAKQEYLLQEVCILGIVFFSPALKTKFRFSDGTLLSLFSL